MQKLRSLDELNALDGNSESSTIHMKRCSHEFELVSGSQMKCKKCPAGWTGPRVSEIYRSWKSSK